MRLLFFMHSVNYDRLFEDALDALLSRGHEVHVAFDRVDKMRGRSATATFDELARRHPGLTYGESPPRTSRMWSAAARSIRSDRDYLRYLERTYADAGPLRERARHRAHAGLRAALAAPGVRSAAGRRCVSAALRALDLAVPLEPALVDFVSSHRPDAVLVTPLVNFGSLQDDYVRVAHSLGLPVVLPVASWDNLTNKGLIRAEPDLVLVWNELQREEATQLHGIPADRVVVTGAHSYDHWFSWEPATTLEEFAAKTGVRSGRPFVLYVGSSSFIAPNEPPVVRRWLERLRSSRFELLRDLDVLIRPHPTNLSGWEDTDLTDLHAHVWPPAGERLRGTDSKSAYFDSLYHSSAVVGINTSALVEASIVERPVLTIVEEGTAKGQVGTLHFAHIARSVLRVANSWDEHEQQLADAIEHGADGRERAFAASFLRPNGMELAAAPQFVQAVERVTSMPRPTRVDAPAAAILRPAAAALGLPATLRYLRKRARKRVLLPLRHRLASVVVRR